MDDVADGELDDLAGFGTRNIGDRDDLGRNVPRACAQADRRFDASDKRVVQLRARPKPQEKDDAHIARPVLSDRKRLDDFRDLLDLSIDLGGADAHAAGIERGIGTAMDDHAAMLGPFGKVAVAPYAREAFEIGGTVFGAL